MDGKYIPIGDDYGIIGFEYECPKCKHVTSFTDCETGCEKCKFSEPYTDPDNWYEAELKKPVNERAWNNGPPSICE